MVLRGSFLLAGFVAIVGCSQSDFGAFPTPDELPPTPDGPGHPAWGDEDISCVTTADCAPNETCDNNICMPERCSSGPYDSQSPLGPLYVFFDDEEIIAADDTMVENAYWVDGYLPSGTSIEYMDDGSWNAGTSRVLDVAGGNLLGTRPDGAVSAIQGSATLKVLHKDGNRYLDIAFQPIAVAAGDIDQDSIDEIVAIGANGQYAICDAVEETCVSDVIDNASDGYDVTVGDIDGDNSEEPVFLVERGGDTQLVALNPDYEVSGEPKWVGGESDELMAISADVIDDSGVAKIIGLRDGGLLGFGADKLDTIEIKEDGAINVLGSVDVSTDGIDVEVADLDMDGRAEIVLLFGEREIEVRRPLSASSHSVLISSTLANTQTPTRIGLADLDGNAPTAKQIAGPELVSGGITPLMALQFPPYSNSFSDGTSYLFVGKTDNVGEDFSDSMSVRYGVGVGFEAKIAGVVRTGFMSRFGQEWGKRRSMGKNFTIGARFSISPDIDAHGNDYSVVMLSSGCFHNYGYEIDDPAGALDEQLDGSIMGLLVPVGGQTTVWSSKRYNALARHLGGLPIINTPVRIGDPSSYASSPQTTDGHPVPADDFVFPTTPSLRISDVGIVGFWLAVGEYETNEQSKSIDLSGYGNFGVGPVSVNYDLGVNQSRSHSVTVGSDALFGGGTPAIPDDPGTPEDEHATHGFTYSPAVHREYYEDSNGQTAGYYVLSFSTSE